MLASSKNLRIFASQLRVKDCTREHSSAGSEHLPYKQGVIGSNPIAPTISSKMIIQLF